MPKGRTKKKREIPVHMDSTSDSESVGSSMDGAGGSVLSEEGGAGVATPEEELEEDMESHIAELSEQLADKNLRTRLEGVCSLNKLFSAKLLGEQLMGRKETLLDLVLRGLKKAQGHERCGLAKLAMLVVLQLGLDFPDIQLSLHPLGTTLAQDSTISPAERAEILRMLGMTTFVHAANVVEMEHTMRILEELFRKCKHEAIITAAVQSWTLLLTIAPDHMIPSLFASALPVLNQLLERDELSVRLAVGVGVALLFELARDCGGEGEELMEAQAGSDTYTLIQQLATESNRHTSRKDRNQTRSCFRDILLSLDDGSVPEKTVKIGFEELPLNSWAKLCQYNGFKELLGSGMNAHLKQNDLLRDIFQMGPAPLHSVETKASRLERKYMNACVAKHRTQSRGKQRDKRAVL